MLKCLVSFGVYTSVVPRSRPGARFDTSRARSDVRWSVSLVTEDPGRLPELRYESLRSFQFDQFD